MPTLIQKRRRLTGNFRRGGKYCVDTAGNCCGTPGTCLPTGYTALRKQFRRIYLPRGAILGESWCEEAGGCCEPAGTGTEDCPVVNDCCPGGMSSRIAVDITTDPTCDTSGNSCVQGRWILAYGSGIWSSKLSGGSQPSGCSFPEMYMQCSGGVLTIYFSTGGSSTVTITSCCPFAGTVDNPADVMGACVTSMTLSEVPSASTGATCRVLLKKRRIYLPPGLEPSSLNYCVYNSENCCNDPGVIPCCEDSQLPTTFYLTADIPGCSMLHGVSIPAEFSYSVNNSDICPIAPVNYFSLWNGPCVVLSESEDANYLYRCCAIARVTCIVGFQEFPNQCSVAGRGLSAGIGIYGTRRRKTLPDVTGGLVGWPPCCASYPDFYDVNDYYGETLTSIEVIGSLFNETGTYQSYNCSGPIYLQGDFLSLNLPEPITRPDGLTFACDGCKNQTGTLYVTGV